jgi:hypothetical protein
MNQKRKRLPQNTPKARAGRATERPSGMGSLGQPAGRLGWKRKEKGNPVKIDF